MKIGYAGPIAFDLLRSRLDARDRDAYAGSRFPQGSLLIGALLDAGHELVVYTLDHDLVAPGRALDLHGPGLRVRVFPYRPRFRWTDAFRVEVAALREALDEDVPDVVHAQWSYEYALAAMASGRPHVVTVRDWAPLIASMQRRPLAWVYRVVRAAMNRRVLRGAQALTVTSPYMVDLVARHAGREARLVPNALSADVFVAADRLTRGRPPIVLSVNNAFDARKNVQALLRAFPDVRAAVPGAQLRLVGLGYGPGGVAEAWARHEGLAEGVAFVGSLAFPHVLEELSAAALLAHPSREESFGGTLLEAMASGTPVVAGRESGAVPWVLDQGRAGVLTDVEDPAAVAVSIVRVLEDPQLASELARLGRDRARRFDLDHTVRAYLGVYASAMREAPRFRGRRAA